MYVIGVGSSIKPSSGVKVISPVVGFTLQVPSPGTTKSSPGADVPSICKVEGSRIRPSAASSLSSTSIITGSPGIFSEL